MDAPLSDTELRALVDRLLLEQGRLDPLELLLAADLLGYADYEGWRLGREPDLQDLLQVPAAQAAELLARAARYTGAQRLAESPLEHRGWGSRAEPLRIGSHTGLVRGCAAAFTPPANRRQLDLFHDNSALLLEQTICQALAERRTEAAREAVLRLLEREPGHRRVRAFLRLLQALDEPESSTVPAKSRLREIEDVVPLAREILGHRARDFLAPLWASLAESLAGRPFNPGSPRLHASFAWAQAERWTAARDAVETTPSWRAQPILVLAHAEACWRSRQWGAARRDWARLCWSHPEEAERALGSAEFPDRCLAELWSRFGDADLSLETQDFPSWLVVADPGEATAVPAEEAPQDDRGAVYRLLHRLVSEGDSIALRRELAKAHPGLLSVFLRRRG